MRILVLPLYWVLLLPPFLRWSQTTTDAQIAKMQAAAFNSPGAAAPVPPRILLIAGLLLLGHLGLTRLLRLSLGQSLIALLAGNGMGAAIAIFVWRP